MSPITMGSIGAWRDFGAFPTTVMWLVKLMTRLSPGFKRSVGASIGWLFCR
jgi:hypothetical protein